MAINNAFDFDDLIINGYKAFKNDEPFADQLRNRFKYVLASFNCNHLFMLKIVSSFARRNPFELAPQFF